MVVLVRSGNLSQQYSTDMRRLSRSSFETHSHTTEESAPQVECAAKMLPFHANGLHVRNLFLCVFSTEKCISEKAIATRKRHALQTVRIVGSMLHLSMRWFCSGAFSFLTAVALFASQVVSCAQAFVHLQSGALPVAADRLLQPCQVPAGDGMDKRR